MFSHEYLGYVVFVIDNGVPHGNALTLHDADEAVRAMITIIDEERSLDFDIRSGHTPDPESEQKYERMRNDARQLDNIDLENGRILNALPVTGADAIKRVNDGDSDGQKHSSQE